MDVGTKNTTNQKEHAMKPYTKAMANALAAGIREVFVDEAQERNANALMEMLEEMALSLDHVSHLDTTPSYKAGRLAKYAELLNSLLSDFDDSWCAIANRVRTDNQ